MRKFYSRFFVTLTLLLCTFLGYSQVSVTATAGTAGPTTYTTLKAAFDAINSGTHQGNITVGITGNTTETAAAILKGSGSGSTLFTSVLIKPATGITAAITGTLTDALVILDSTSNVVIDGSNTVNGTTKNLTFSNLSTSGAGLVLVDGATNNTIKNSILQAATTVSAVLVLANSNAPAGNNNNTIQNNDITRNAIGSPLMGIFNIGTSGKPNTGNIFRGNRIFDFTEFGFIDGGATSTGYSNNTLIEGNEIYSTTASLSDVVTGIYLENINSISNMVISKNKIHSLVSAAGGTVTAIDLYDATSVTIVNNMISLTTNPNSTLGIGQGTGPGAVIKVYHNTVFLSGTTTDVSAAYVKYYTSTGDDVRNNIFVNKRISTGDKQYAIVNASTTSFTSNFNNLVSTGNAQNAVGAVITAAVVDYVTLANWQAGTSLDANSTNVDPIFISATDLHLNVAGNGAISNTGTPIATVTVDYDNDTRSTLTPDVGADEFTSAGGDLTPPTITYSLLGPTCSTGDRVFSGITIQDASGVPTTGALVPRIYYKKSTGSTWYSKPGTLTAGTGISGTWSFTITAADMGTLAVGETIQYYVIAQDVMATPNISSSPSGVVATNVNTVTTHPTNLNSYVIGGSLSGNYNVGSGQTFTTLTAAVAGFNAGCLTGAVTFTLMDASYTNETLPIVISNNASSSSTNTLTIKPATGVNATISGASNVAIIQLKGADYVTIDGSNTAGGTTRNLTVSTSGTGFIPLIWVTSGSADGANNNTIKNLSLAGSSTATTIAGILTGSGITLGLEAEFPNNNNTISNISVVKAQNGIYIRGNATSANYDQNWLVTGNTLGSATAADKLSFRGIFVGNVQNITISKNIVSGIVTPVNSTATVSGISAGLGINGGSITGNKITDLKQMHPDGYGVNGILLSSSSTAANLTVSNNFIADVAGQGFAGSTIEDNGYGIVVNSGAGYGIYYNSVNMNANQAAAGGLPSAFHVTSDVTTAGAINLRNNIFVNSQTTGTQRYAISSVAPNTVFSSINYNNYYSAGPNIGFIGTPRATLADIVTGFGGNANSKNVLPVFVSATDLHLTSVAGNAALDNAATPITGITVDFDNDARSATTPDIGGDEFSSTSTCTNPVITVQPAPVTTCLQQSATFTVTATGTNLSYQWQFNGANIPGATASSFTINNISATFAGGYRVIVSSGSCSVTSNVANLTVSGPCTSIPTIDEDINSVVLMPNVVNDATTLRVNAGRSTRINWTIVDMSGKVVMTFNSQVAAGQNDIKVIVSRLGSGTYHIMGQSAKGRTEVLRMIKF
jgi:trimeric autotransporter adhesin